MYIYIYIYHVQFNVAKLFTEFTFTIMKCQVKHVKATWNMSMLFCCLPYRYSPPKKNISPHRTPPLMAKCHATRHKNQLMKYQ